MILDRDDPRRIDYRSPRPVHTAKASTEGEGVVPNIVFPTAIDVRGWRLDVYFGAADTRSGGYHGTEEPRSCGIRTAGLASMTDSQADFLFPGRARAEREGMGRRDLMRQYPDVAGIRYARELTRIWVSALTDVF